MSTTTLPSEAQAVWRQRAGGRLNGIWGKSPESQDNHLLVIFGNVTTDKPLSTPLAMSTNHEPEAGDEVLIVATELWELPWQEPHPNVVDFDSSLQRMRIVIATSTPVSQALIQELLETARDQVARDLPDEMLMV